MLGLLLCLGAANGFVLQPTTVARGAALRRHADSPVMRQTGPKFAEGLMALTAAAVLTVTPPAAMADDVF